MSYLQVTFYGSCNYNYTAGLNIQTYFRVLECLKLWYYHKQENKCVSEKKLLIFTHKVMALRIIIL